MVIEMELIVTMNTLRSKIEGKRSKTVESPEMVDCKSLGYNFWIYYDCDLISKG